MRRAALFTLCAFAACRKEAAPPPELEAFAAVDPRIGTGGTGYGQGNTFVGACVPFGMLRLGPDTHGKFGRLGFMHTAGYWYEDDSIEGFSLTHMSGTGVADYGNFLFTAADGMTSGKTSESGYGQHFSHDSEQAEPGYYAVTLAGGTRVELTAAKRAGQLRFSFAPAADATLIIDASHALGEGSVLAGNLHVDPAARTLSGWIHSAGDFVNAERAFDVFLAARFDATPVEVGSFRSGALNPGATDADGATGGLYLRFGPNAAPLTVQAAVSFVDADHAQQNLDADLGSDDFAATRAHGTEAWRELLGRVDIGGGSSAERRMFYTGLYHALLMPTLFTDADGSYRGLDGAVHSATGFTYYTDFSLWDTYRTAHPLFTLLAPERQADFVATLVHMAQDGGILPRWPLASVETSSMIGSPADIVLSESYQKGFTDFDVDAAWAAMQLVANAPPPPGAHGAGRDGISECLAAGFCPADKMSGSVSRTLEYAYADASLAALGRALGHDAEAASFAARAHAYAALFDPTQKFFLPHNADGSLAISADFDPAAWNDAYTEGDAWQYLWLVPHDVEGFAALFGGQEAMLARLQQFFALSQAAGKAYQPDLELRLPDPYYWHGNEPDMHAAYLFALAGHPELGAPWIRWIMSTRYSDGPEGLDGNDDAGTLSAWYVFSALGFYPVAGSDRYVIGAPLFASSRVKLAAGDLLIVAPKAASQPYVFAARLNGVALAAPTFRHADILGGGLLELSTSPTPRPWTTGP